MLTFPNRKRHSGKVSGETLAGIGILFLLGIIAASVLVVQGRYDESFFKKAVPQKSIVMDAPVVEEPAPEIIPGIETTGFHPMSDAEIFNSDTLSEKINGKADLYIECDFRELKAQRFVNQRDPSLWFEAYIYDMAEPRNAFSVYSMQRRPNTKDSVVAPFSYTTENSLFLAHGRYYVEIVGAQSSETLEKALGKTAEKIIAAYPSEPFSLKEFSFLPPENMQKHTMKYFIKNTFGFEKLDLILTVNYNISGKEVMAFISDREDIPEAKTLKEDYQNFLVNIGGKKIQDDSIPIPGLCIVDLAGDLEYIFSIGRFFAGIHAAPGREQGDLTARILYDYMNLQMQK